MRGGLGLACWPKAEAPNSKTDRMTHNILATCRRGETGLLLTTTPSGDAHLVLGPISQNIKAQKCLPWAQGTVDPLANFNHISFWAGGSKACTLLCRSEFV